jgi:hypothetical protein
MQDLRMLYVTFDSIVEGVGASQVKALVKRLRKKQEHLTLISFEKHSPSKFLMEEMEIAGVCWFPMKFGRSGLIGSLFRMLKLYFKIWSLSRFDVIHARSELATFTALITPRSTPVIWDMRSLWSDQKYIIDGKRSRVVNYCLRKIENICASRAAGLNTLTAACIPVLLSRNSKLPNHRTMIPTSVDTDRFKNVLVSSSPVNCLLSGTLNDFYNLDLIDQFITRAKLDFRIDTMWARPTETNQTYEFRNLFSSTQVTFEEMPSFMSRFGFGLILCNLANDTALKASSPTKAAEFLSMGMPIIVSSGIGDLSGLVAEKNIGLILDSENEINSVINQLLELLRDPKLSERCRNTAIEMYSLEAAVDKYLELYSLVISKR